MALKKYKVARAFRLPVLPYQEGTVIELDETVADLYVRQGNINPVDDSESIDADAQAKVDADIAAQKESEDAQAKADAAAAAPKVGDACKRDDGTDGVLAENPEGADQPLVCVASAPADEEIKTA